MQCEVEANLEIDVTSLVSTKGFESKDGEPPREKFYLTTAINYTNGKRDEEPCRVCLVDEKSRGRAEGFRVIRSLEAIQALPLIEAFSCVIPHLDVQGTLILDTHMRRSRRTSCRDISA